MQPAGTAELQGSDGPWFLKEDFWPGTMELLQDIELAGMKIFTV